MGFHAYHIPQLVDAGVLKHQQYNLADFSIPKVRNLVDLKKVPSVAIAVLLDGFLLG